jgi:hypothetical protein
MNIHPKSTFDKYNNNKRSDSKKIKRKGNFEMLLLIREIENHGLDLETEVQKHYSKLEQELSKTKDDTIQQIKLHYQNLIAKIEKFDESWKQNIFEYTNEFWKENTLLYTTLDKPIFTPGNFVKRLDHPGSVRLSRTSQILKCSESSGSGSSLARNIMNVTLEFQTDWSSIGPFLEVVPSYKNLIHSFPNKPFLWRMKPEVKHSKLLDLTFSVKNSPIKLTSIKNPEWVLHLPLFTGNLNRDFKPPKTVITEVRDGKITFWNKKDEILEVYDLITKATKHHRLPKHSSVLWKTCFVFSLSEEEKDGKENIIAVTNLGMETYQNQKIGKTLECQISSKCKPIISGNRIYIFGSCCSPGGWTDNEGEGLAYWDGKTGKYDHQFFLDLPGFKSKKCSSFGINSRENKIYVLFDKQLVCCDLNLENVEYCKFDNERNKIQDLYVLPGGVYGKVNLGIPFANGIQLRSLNESTDPSFHLYPDLAILFSSIPVLSKASALNVEIISGETDLVLSSGKEILWFGN